MSRSSLEVDIDRLAARLEAGGLPPRFPPAADRAAWGQALSGPWGEARRAEIRARAEAAAAEPWPELPARLYRLYAETGDRERFESACFARRNRLAAFVLAECADADGVYVDAAVDALWSILEEATWVVPAHVFHGSGSPTPFALPPSEVTFVDLFSAETAVTVAMAVRLLEDRLHAVSPAILPRARRKVLRRVVDPCLENESWWWWDGRNNWTPWICGNALIAAAALDPDPRRVARLARKLAAACGRFVDRYGEDGGCDEGVMYWGVAGGAHLVFLEELDRLTGSTPDLFGDPKLTRMLEFPARIHLGGGRYPLFADAKPHRPRSRAKVLRAGHRVGSARLLDLGWLDARGYDPAAEPDPELGSGFVGRDLDEALMTLFWTDPAWILGARPDAGRDDDDWLADIQWLVARGPGLGLAAKGGHNDESHNHNDVGNFVISCRHQWAVVDAGIGAYTAATFGDRRYEQPLIRSGGHNVPLVNGCEQAPGREHAARDVRYERAGEVSRLTLDLAPAYPEAAGLERLERVIELDRAVGAVTVRDRVRTRAAGIVCELPLLCAVPPASVPGGFRLDVGEGGVEVRTELEGTLETVPLDDAILTSVWGDRLHRIRLRASAPSRELAYTVRFEAG